MGNASDVTIGQAFQYEVEKEARKKEIIFECLERANPQLRVELVNGVPSIVANRAGVLALAKLLVTIGAGNRLDGVYLQLREDFDGSREEVLRVRLQDSAQQNHEPPDEKQLAVA